MPRSALNSPNVDPTPIFEHFRGSYGSELLTATVAHFGVFKVLAEGPLTTDKLRKRLGLAERPATVLLTALRAMGLIATDDQNITALTPLAEEHLAPGGYFEVSDYIGLTAESPGVLEIIERLRTNRPAGAGEEPGTAFVYREGETSAMEAEASARHLTLALCGRAKNVAPHVARAMPMEGTLLDVGGGTGIYAIACVQANDDLRAVVFDRPEVLKVAAEFADEYGVADRLELVPGDMFTTELPPCDYALLSNILHDWDAPECRQLVARCADAVRPGGAVLVHDVFLNDTLDGPLPIALYSAALFTLTEGRAYSAAEYRDWLSEANLQPGEITPTLVHCGLLPGWKR